MSDADRVIYQFDVANIDFKENMTAWCIGLRKYIIKDELKGTKQAIKKQTLLKAAHYVVMALYGALVWYIFRGLFDIVSMFGTIVTF